MKRGAALAGTLLRLPQRLMSTAVRGYRLLLKPWLGNACRFEPTCSQYALDALQRHGAARGAVLAGARILRCHPWCAGGCDPVPDRFALRGLFTRFDAAAADAGANRPHEFP